MTPDTTEMTELLRTFVAFQSTPKKSDQKRNCLTWVQATFFDGWKHDVEFGEHEKSPYLYMEHPEAEWLWFAHVDVVPADRKMFSVRIEGDKAFGRGVKDMKGSALPFLMAFRDLLKQGDDPKVSLLLTSDEEVAGKTIPHLLGEGMTHPPVAWTPDSRNDYGIITEQKGIAWFDIEIHGKGGHAAVPWEADNPMLKAAEVIRMIEASFPVSSEDTWHATVVPTQLDTSHARNVIPESVTLKVDCRFPSHAAANPDAMRRRLEDVLPDWCDVNPGHAAADPLHTPTDLPLLKEVRKHAEEVIGREVPNGKECAASDARYFAAEGIPAFIFGPMGGELHADGEWISIPSMVQHYEISRRILTR